MIIGIMGAMPDEVDQLCARLENVTVEPYGGVEYHKGTLAGKQVVVCCAGMGKANAAATTQVLITKFGAEKIIFSGIAGNMTSKIGIGDVVIGKTVLYHDAQLDMICQNPPFLKEYTGDPALIAAAEKACADAGVKALAGKIATGDMFVGDSATKAAIEALNAAEAAIYRVNSALGSKEGKELDKDTKNRIKEAEKNLERLTRHKKPEKMTPQDTQALNAAREALQAQTKDLVARWERRGKVRS